MVHLLEYAALVATLCFSLTTAEDLSKPKACPCYTATTHILDDRCPTFKPSRPCIVPFCLRITTSTIPGPNTACPHTPTATSLLPCVTACPTGCAGTSTLTQTYSSSCLPATPTPPPPPTSMTTHTRSCYTRTLPATKTCPEDALACPTPDCVVRRTTTVTAGPVSGCETTRTVVAERTCRGACSGVVGCDVVWVTATVGG